MFENFKRLTIYRISDSEQRLNSNSRVGRNLFEQVHPYAGIIRVRFAGIHLSL